MQCYIIFFIQWKGGYVTKQGVFTKTLLLMSTLFLAVGCGSQSSDDLSTSENSSETVLWNEQVDAMLYQAVGDYYRQIPVYTANSYESFLYNSQGITLANVFCYTDDTSAENTYSIVLKLNGFSTSQYSENGSTYSVATARVSSYEILCLQYQTGSVANKGTYLNIMTYLVEDRLQSWPSNQIISTIGQDIPHCDAEYYQFATQTYGELTLAMVACYGIEDPNSALQNYLLLLESESYYAKSYQGAYYCTNDDTGLEIDFYYDTDYEYLLIQAYVMPGSATWPSSDLEELFEVEIPQYNETGVRYFYGLAQDENKDLIYEIDCANASPSSEETYKTTLESNGWVRCEEYDYETWGYIYIINKGEENECRIQFYYDLNGMTLVIKILILNIE